jgi:5-(carboxyamino)imidazole ribonucleotide mutase
MTDETRVLILMGSDSDLDVMRGAFEVLDQFRVGYQVRVLSVHRAPTEAIAEVRAAEQGSVRVIIACAGMAAHLAGAVAAHTVLPVIGVPVSSGPLNGLDALYSTVMMPPGVPVGTMAINGARNAGVFAVQILAGADETLRAALRSFKGELTRAVLEKDRLLQEKLKR